MKIKLKLLINCIDNVFIIAFLLLIFIRNKFMLKKRLFLILRGAFLGFCLFLLNLIIFSILFYAHWFISGNPSLNDDFEFFLAIIISTLLIRIIHKNIHKEHLITALFFFTLFHYSKLKYENLKDIFSFIQINGKYIILIPILPILSYFLPNIIVKIKFFNNFKNINFNFKVKVKPIILLALQAMGISYLILLISSTFSLIIDLPSILNNVPIYEISLIIPIIIIFSNFVKKYKKPLNIIEKFKFSLLYIGLIYYIPIFLSIFTIIFHPIMDKFGYYGIIKELAVCSILFLIPIFLYVSIINEILNIKYIVKPHENSSLKTNKLRYLFILLGFFVSLIPIYLINQGIINILPVNILLLLLPLVVVWGLLKLLYREIKGGDVLELIDDENQPAIQ